MVILDQQEELTDYEKIQQRTKKAKEDLKKEIEVKLSAKKTRPSKSLKSHMENMKGRFWNEMNGIGGGSGGSFLVFWINFLT